MRRHTDWVAWHRVYDEPDSRFSQRLQLVQTHLRAVLDQQPPGPIRVVVPCAGQGHVLLGALADHPRRNDVIATLIELDPDNVEIARSTATQNSPTTLREHFEEAKFTEVAIHVDADFDYEVGVERFDGAPLPFRANVRLFSFRDPGRFTNRTFGRVRRSIAYRTRRMNKGRSPKT